MCVECCVVVFAVLLLVGFSAIVTTLWYVSLCLPPHHQLSSRVDSSWKLLSSVNFILSIDGSKLFLVPKAEQNDFA